MGKNVVETLEKLEKKIKESQGLTASLSFPGWKVTFGIVPPTKNN